MGLACTLRRRWWRGDQRLPSGFGGHFVQGDTRFFLEQRKLQVAQCLAARPEARNALLAQCFFQLLNLQLRPVDFLHGNREIVLQPDNQRVFLPQLFAVVTGRSGAHGV
jgi:hypothetical protein